MNACMFLFNANFAFSCSFQNMELYSFVCLFVRSYVDGDCIHCNVAWFSSQRKMSTLHGIVRISFWLVSVPCNRDFTVS